ncbi:MAG: hypothetical protein ACREGJ_03980 [Candidatus Saccharimonadales bacterium]
MANKEKAAEDQQPGDVTAKETIQHHEAETYQVPVEKQDQEQSDDPDTSEEPKALEQTEVPPVAAVPLHPKHRLMAFLKTKKGKIVAAVIALLLVIAVLSAIPYTRYAIAGTVVKKDVVLSVIDSKTNKPVSEVEVTLANRTSKTDQQGKVEFKSVAVGEQKAVVKKKYYKDASQTVLLPIFSAPKATELKIEATGHQVPVKVLNKISGKPIEKAIVSALDTAVTTDEKGEALLVLPADKISEKGTVKLQGYNDLTVDIEVTEQTTDKNAFSLTPSGKLYFLSKRTGKINVMKSNLDGSDAQVVVAGTGKEEDGGTVLLASRDWKYLALKAKRDSTKPKLYLLDTSNDKLSIIDEGNAEFTPIGWYNERFIFKTARNDMKSWQPKQNAIKSFNASTAKLSILDETNGEGSGEYDYTNEVYGDVYILENLVVYSKNWSSSYYSPHKEDGKQDVIMSVRPSGTESRVLKGFSARNSAIVASKIYEPQEVIFDVFIDGKEGFWEYEEGKIFEAKEITRDTFFNKFYPTHLLSPSSQLSFWYEPRDGKNTLFVGSAKGGEGQEIATLSEYTPYGWYGDDYLLVAKKGSELYILPRQDAAKSQPVKVTDYHKPTLEFYGYGYGYGGF